MPTNQMFHVYLMQVNAYTNAISMHAHGPFSCGDAFRWLAFNMALIIYGRKPIQICIETFLFFSVEHYFYANFSNQNRIFIASEQSIVKFCSMNSIAFDLLVDVWNVWNRLFGFFYGIRQGQGHMHFYFCFHQF